MRPVRCRRIAAILPLILAFAPSAIGQAPVAMAQPVAQDTGFEAYLEGLRTKARAQGVTDATMNAVFPTLTFNPRVIQLDQNQPGGSFDSPIPPFAPYLARHVDARKIAKGRAVYAANRPLLKSIEDETGVPESIMVAIYGHETNYGSFTGDFDLMRSLATLAYEGRRRTLFEPEFIATMLMYQDGIPRETLVGSYAGATGYPQFLPTVYRRMARDGDGDGKADIWRSEADAMASIANYFRQSGWRAGQPWGIAVRVPATLDRNAVRALTVPPRCSRVFGRHSRWLSIAEWRELGVTPTGADRLADDMLATLLEPDGPNATAYLLTGNYRVILDYNCSNFYALSVGLLADAVDN